MSRLDEGDDGPSPEFGEKADVGLCVRAGCFVASVGRAAYAIDWLGMGRSSRPDPKELVSGRKASAKERVEKVSRRFSDGSARWGTRPLNLMSAIVLGGEVLYGFVG